MEVVKRTYTIQWVGPFHSSEDIKDYKYDDATIDIGYFNFYCFEARNRSNSKWRRYLGIHQKNDGIDKRLNDWHEHYRLIKDYKYKNIWIGTFGNDRDQKDKSNIDIVETLFIRAYKDELDDNEKKKKLEPAESVCVVNLWYNIYDQVRHNRNHTISFMDDVIVWDNENHRTLKGRLSEVKE